MKILVVEDEHRIAQSMKKGLEQEHHIVDIAYTGTDGLDFAMEGSHDLIILDLMLPEIDGITITQKVRTAKIHTPILMLTAKGQIQDKVVGLDAGADDYLTKPFSFEELLARIRALSRRPQLSNQTILEVGTLKLDPHQFTVTRSNKTISLSQKEFTLLEYLMRHPGIILSKTQIMNQLWDYDADILPNTIEVYIRNLRLKIDKPFSHEEPLLQTVRGFGYKIEG